MAPERDSSSSTVATSCCGCGPAFADAEAKYNPTLGSDSVKSVAGVFYAGLLAVFAYRLLTRRAKKFT